MTTPQYLRADLIAIAAGTGALALLLAALGFQYLGGIQPCEMCHWQRWPHIAAAIMGLIGGGFLPRRYGFYVASAVIVLVALSGGIGLYQTLGQYHLVPMPQTCSVSHPYILGSNMVPEVRCDMQVYILGLVFPAWNVIFSFLIAGLSIFALTRKPDAA